MKNTVRNRRRAAEILEYIEMFPERHNQSNWFNWEEDYLNELADGDEQKLFKFEENADPLTEVNVCKTTMCVAGTAVFLDRGVKGFKKFSRTSVASIDWEVAGGEILGLDGAEAHALFYADNGCALELLSAIANGDEERFEEIRINEYQAL